MSNNLNINMTQTQLNNIQANPVTGNMTSQFKIAGLDKENDTTAVEMKISKIGRLKFENSPVNTVNNEKTAGVTAAREEWENDSADLKKEILEKDKLLEQFRLDDPDAYARVKKLEQRLEQMSANANNITYAKVVTDVNKLNVHDRLDVREIQVDADRAEELKFQKEVIINPSDRIKSADEELPSDFNEINREIVRIETKWIMERTKQYSRNPVVGQLANINALENKYSTDGHDTRINYYTSADSKLSEDSLWRYDAKFNVLLDAHAAKNLDENMRKKIDIAVNEMKGAEKVYEGNLKRLQFGAKLWDDGRVTYHARYEGCGSEDGIMADSVNELLKMLMEK